jgi:hypothetical protein
MARSVATDSPTARPDQAIPRARVRAIQLVRHAVGGDARRPSRRVALWCCGLDNPRNGGVILTRAGHESTALARKHTAGGAPRHPGVDARAVDGKTILHHGGQFWAFGTSESPAHAAPDRAVM